MVKDLKMSIYSEKREQLNGLLSIRYSMALKDKNYEEAYKVLKDLMRYRFVNKYSPEVAKKYFTAFKKAGIDVEPKLFEYDIRRSDGHLMIPDNLNVEPRQFKFNVRVDKHWMLRAEHQYVGEQICDEHVVEYVVRRNNYSGAINNKFSKFKELVLKYNKYKRDFSDYSFEDGEYHIWEAVLSSGYTSHITSLGYVVTHFTYKDVDGAEVATPYVEVVLDTDTFLENKFDVQIAFNSLESSIRAEYEAVGYNNIKLVIYNDHVAIGKEQRLNREVVPTVEEYTKILQEKADREALENEAFALHMSVEELIKLKLETERKAAEAENKK